MNPWLLGGAIAGAVGLVAIVSRSRRADEEPAAPKQVSFEPSFMGQEQPLPFPAQEGFQLTGYPVDLIGDEPVLRWVVTGPDGNPYVTNDNGAKMLSDIAVGTVIFDQQTGETIVEVKQTGSAPIVRFHFLGAITEPRFGDGDMLPVVLWKTVEAKTRLDTSGTRFTKLK